MKDINEIKRNPQGQAMVGEITQEDMSGNLEANVDGGDKLQCKYIVGKQGSVNSQELGEQAHGL